MKEPHLAKRWAAAKRAFRPGTSPEPAPTRAKAQARARVGAWIDDYNTSRRHSACQMMSPAGYEQMLAAKEAA